MSSTLKKSSQFIARLTGAAFLLSAFEALAAIWFIFQIPGDSRNALILGLSGQRLALVVFLTLALLAALLLGILFLTKTERTAETVLRLRQGGKKSRVGFLLLAGLTAFGFVLTLIPSYQFGIYQAYFERLYPVLVWLALAGLQLTALVLYLRIDSQSIRPAKGWFSRSSALWPVAAVLGVFLAVWGVMAASGLGLKPDNVHWNDAGAPILLGQIAVSFGVGLLVHQAEKKVASGKKGLVRFDVVLVALIWLAATVIWIREPLPHSFFAPGPYPPNNEPYPFSDASSYDTSGQFALLGQGLMNRDYVDKPLYSAFLAFLHVLAGEHYFPVVNLQIAVIALFPALLYLCGKLLHSRASGAAAAFLIIFREINSIGATLWILSSNTKVMMSEPLTMLGIGFFVFFLVLWALAPQKSLHWLAAAGGALGLTTLVRHNPWLLVPVGLAIILIVEWKHWRRLLLGTAVFILAFTTAISPWMLRNELNNGKPFYFMVPLEGVVMLQRYNVRLNPVEAPTAAPGSGSVQPTPSIGTPAPAGTPQAAASPPAAPAAQAATSNPVLRIITRAFSFVPAHFFHNLLVTSAIFPTAFSFEDLEHTVKSPASMWDAAWTGKMSAGQAAVLLFFLMLVAIGVGMAWKRWRLAGVVPAIIYLSYNLATAAARTSGARYMQPADWVALFYTAIGMFQAWLWLKGLIAPDAEKARPARESLAESGEEKRTWPWKSLLAVAAVIAIGSLPFLSELVFPRHFAKTTPSELAARLVDEGWAAQMNLTAGDLRSFLQNQNAVILEGRALYPRYYGIGGGEPDRFSPYREQAYPRLIITAIGQYGTRYGNLPLAVSPAFFPNGADVILLGCEAKTEIDLAAVVVTAPEVRVYRREPQSALACPQPPVVCDDNRVCK